MESRRPINKLDSIKSLALKYDAGKVKSERYGEATISGYFLLLTRHEFPGLNVEQLKEKCSRWLNEMGLEKYREALLVKGNIPLLIACSIRDVDLEKLEVYFKFLTFSFLIDDLVAKLNSTNENNPIKKKEDLLRWIENLVSIIKNHGDGNATKAVISKMNPVFKIICVALSSLCSCCFEQMDEDEYKRFGKELVEFLRVNKWIKEYHGLPHTEDEFFHLRIIDLAASCIMYCMCFAKDIRIPNEIRTHPVFQRFYRNIFIQQSLSNDILSLETEIACNEEYNFVLFKCRKYTLQKAIDKVNKAANEASVNLMKDSMKLKWYFPSDEGLNNFIETLKCAMDGALYWSLLGRRYGKLKLEVGEVEHSCDYNSWLEQMINVENMKEPRFSLESDNSAIPALFG